MTAIPTKFYSPAFCQNVHEHFKRMRQEQPVFQGNLTRFRKAWLVTRYQDCIDLMKDERLCKNPNNIQSRSRRSRAFWVPKSFRPLMKNMLNSDEPDHRRLRNLVHKAFTPSVIADLQPRIETITQQLIRGIKADLHRGPIDFVNRFALPLPLAVISDLIGIPTQQRASIEKMTNRLMAPPSAIGMLRAVPAINTFTKYIRQLAQQRIKQPENDLLTALAHAEENGETFSEDELVGMVFLLTVAGHETTVGLISNAFVALQNHPKQRQLLRDKPILLDSAVEEFLRFDGPLATTEMAFAKVDITLHGQLIKEGAMVFPAILSANRDETAFENPDHLDIEREPNRHLAFGHGIHYCLGAPLARLETSTAFRFLNEQLPNLRLAQPDQKPIYKKMFVVHRPTELMVCV